MATVLLVPGFGGNKLFRPGGFLTSQLEIWLNPWALATGFLNHLRISDDGLRPYYPWLSPLVAGGRIDAYYPPLEDYLRSRGWSVEWAVSDWRFEIADSVDALVNQIVLLGSPDPVRIVAHSRGGMLAQAALAKLGGGVSAEYVRQVVAVCCAFAGSYCPIPFLAGTILSQPDAKGIWATVGILDNVPFITSSFRDICRSLPGLYELLPNPAVADANGDRASAILYSSVWWSQAGLPVNDGPMTAALARWSSAPAFPPGVRVDAIVGYSFPTPGPYPAVVPARRPWTRGDAVDGDGTVPTWSAERGVTTSQRFPVSHNESLRDPQVLAAIDGLLRS